MGLVQKSFSDIITFSRSSNATRVGPTGLVEYAPHNLILQSQTLDNASWTKTDASITANAVAAPDGTVTADKLVENSSNAAHYVGSTAPSVTDTVPYTISVYAKAAERSVLQIVPSAAGFPVAFANFDLATGVIGSFSGITSYAITSVGNGWYRCSVTLSANATTTSGFVLVVQNSTTAARAGSYTGDGTSGIYLWGAQLAVGPYALDYTPTTSSAVYGPRFDYDPVTLAAKGLLVEEQRTNLLTYSEQFDNAAWTKINSTVTANATTSPDGTVSADLLTATSYNEDIYVVLSKSASAITYTLSVFAKNNVNANSVVLYLSDNSTGQATGFFDLSAATVTTTSGTWSGVSASISSVGSGWFRCTLTATSPATSGLLPGFSWGSPGAAAYFWGAQLEAGSFATSYIPTLASTVTRSADVASVNTLSPWFNATEGTLFAEFDFIGRNPASPGEQQGILSITDNATAPSNAFGLFGAADGTAKRYALCFSGGSLQALLAGTDSAVNTSYKSAARYKANDFALVNGGGAAVTDTSGSVPAGVDRLLLGRLYTTSDTPLNGHLRRAAYYPRILTTAEMQALTS